MNLVPGGSVEVLGVIMRSWSSPRGMHRSMGFAAQE